MLQESDHAGDDPRLAHPYVADAYVVSEHNRTADGLQRATADLAAVRSETDLLRQELAALQATKSFRYVLRLRRRIAGARRVLQGRSVPAPPAPPVPSVSPAPLAPLVDEDYREWVARFDTLDDDARARIARSVALLDDPPTISVVMPVHDPALEFLAAAIRSVRRQIYPHWELCIADDASETAEVVAFLEEAAAADPRIMVVRQTEHGHISLATNAALTLASGAWAAFLDHDDVLPEHALAMVALAVARCPDAKLVYTDEDKLDEAGRRCQPYFKPDFDPILLLGQNYLAHLRVVRRDLLDQLGGCRAGFEGSQDWDLHLRLAEVLLDPAEVVHIPRVLYHWRIHAGSAAATVESKPYAKDAAARAVAEHLERTRQPGRLIAVQGGWWRVRWTIPDPPPSVSVVICTRDGVHLRRCLDSLLLRTSYPRFEVMIVDNGSVEADTLNILASAVQRGRVVRRDPRPFNFSALNNAAVSETNGEFVCLLNDDIEIITPDWIEEMVGHIVQPGVAAVGAKLYYPDGRVQHAGVVIGRGGVACHVGRGGDRLDMGYFGRSALAGQFSAVTAAAMLVRREVFESLGGFDEEHLAVAFNDVDLCIRLRQAGWRVVWTPFAELIHHESATRGLDTVRDPRFAAENACMERRWGHLFIDDPFFNTNLDLVDGCLVLACPPRTPAL